ncbi:uncharacterized protein ACA1_195720 [Acanthamoeba castellanii str. Neff]|uniref:Reverse transcriptase domain-containing protein n=1 Tax=Acanthamoeba castellanii (strain ATCC 30010 / Neff) TaxID=1257118 RepID=L8HF04_ACACF|nr:uncharacterized protein ACA1_195720 [Acanthamoeba castellanii str. Neff]ELR23750.1 hypothetical protein ACA1_195720 [Acanthamoeba castellanii str. Neff]
MVALMRKGIHCLTYMDDLIIMAPSFNKAICHWAIVLKTLSNLGWSINHKKLSLHLSQSKEFLRLMVDLSTKPMLLAQLLLQNLYHNIKHCRDWHSHIHLLMVALNDLQEWMVSLTKWDSQVVSMRPFNVVLNTNASLTGWGVALKDSTTTSVGWWHSRDWHINELELKVVLHTL